MELTPFFRSVLEQDDAPVVLCDLAHTILYMNPSAVLHYQRQGGAALVGKNLLACHSPAANRKIAEVLAFFASSPEHNKVYTFRNTEENKDVYMIALRDETGTLIGYYEKHVYRTPETGALYQMED